MAKLLRAAFCVIFASMAGLPAFADSSIGIVLMHGKWGSPDRVITELESTLVSGGFPVVTPEMPWSGKRLYDVGWDGALAEIDQAIAKLKGKGATRFVVGGHSFGANVALGYAAKHHDVVGVMAVAPGHAPELFARNPEMAAGIEKARAWVAEGKGDSFANFPDLNQGRTRTLSMYPKVFLSYFDPTGQAVMPENAAKMSASTALLWVIGTQDPLFRLGKEYAFEKAPANPKNQYVVVEADHMATPSVARAAIVSWVKGLE